VFAAVAREVAEVLDVDATHLGRFDPDGTVVSVGQWGGHANVWRRPRNVARSLHGVHSSASS
jgi:hypothetical protein